MAGGKLNARKASAAAPSAPASSATPGSPARAAAIASVANPITAMPPARPSAPSMKLYRLAIHAMPRMATTAIAIPPAEGPATTTARAAATRWVPRREATGRLAASSNAEITATTAAMPAYSRASPGAKATATGSAPASIPRPPMRGLGSRCRLRSLGSSTRRDAIALRRSATMAASATMNARTSPGATAALTPASGAARRPRRPRASRAPASRSRG